MTSSAALRVEYMYLDINPADYTRQPQDRFATPENDPFISQIKIQNQKIKKARTKAIATGKIARKTDSSASTSVNRTEAIIKFALNSLIDSAPVLFIISMMTTIYLASATEITTNLYALPLGFVTINLLLLTLAKAQHRRGK